MVSTYLSAATLTEFTIPEFTWQIGCATGVVGSWITAWLTS